MPGHTGTYDKGNSMSTSSDHVPNKRRQKKQSTKAVN